MKNVPGTSPNKVRQARRAARVRGDPDPSEAAMRVGDVAGLRLSPNALEWLRRIALREMGRQTEKLEEAAPYPGQPDRDFAEFYAGLERKLGMLQEIVAGIEAARVEA